MICQMWLGGGDMCTIGIETDESSQPTQFDASRREKKAPKCSRDGNEGAYRSGEGGEEPAFSGPGSELRLRKEKEKNARTQ